MNGFLIVSCIMIWTCNQETMDVENQAFLRRGDTLFVQGHALIFVLPPDTSRLLTLQSSFKSGEIPPWQQFEARAREWMLTPGLRGVKMQFSACRNLMLDTIVYQVPHSNLCVMYRPGKAPYFLSGDSLEQLGVAGVKDFFFSDVP
jgi:hypothetical protein